MENKDFKGPFDTKEDIEKYLGFEPPRIPGWRITIAVYRRPSELAEFEVEGTGEKKALVLSTKTTENDEWLSCVGLVVGIGPDCYLDKEKHPSGPWCKLGDWVVFPVNAGTRLKYRGIPMEIIADDKVLFPVDDPSYVTRD